MRLENFNFYCSNNFLLLHLNSNGIEDDNIQSLGHGLCLVKHRKLFTLCKIQSQWQNSAWGAKYLILIDADFLTKHFCCCFVPGVASDQPNESEIALGLSDDMLMDCGTPESPAAPALPISLAMVNLAMKPNSIVFKKLAVHKTLVATATMLHMIPKQHLLGNLDM